MKVYSLGGSVVRDSLDSIDELASAFPDEQVVVVTGAGDLKEHLEALEGVTNRGQRDLVGIEATRLNARTLMAAMDAHPSVPETPEEVMEAARTGEDVVMGGLVPGYSTDAVAATVAELLDSELYIATTVDGVYDGHPGSGGSERLEQLTHDELLEIVDGDNQPGSHELVDATAVRIAERSSIPVKVFEATPGNLGKPEEAEGTDVVPG